MWNQFIEETEITEKVTKETVKFAEEFGTYLATGRKDEILSTSQLRKFFGEVKKQQMSESFDETKFVLLKPKLAYAVGRANSKIKKQYQKIEDFYNVMSKAIDLVIKEDGEDKKMKFRNFILIFEAIVAYHKAAENK